MVIWGKNGKMESIQKCSKLEEEAELTDLRFRIVESMLERDEKLRKMVKGYLYFYP